MRSPEQILDDLLLGVTTGDIALVEQLYAEDAVLWQNTTGATSDKKRAMKVVRWLVENTEDLAYTNIRRRVWENGFLQEHTMTGIVKANHKPLTVHACLIVTTRDGQMIDVREYMDSRAQDVFSA